MSEQKCPPANVLSDYALGYLNESASSDIDAHLKTCADCQYQVEMAWSDEKDPLVESLRQSILPQQSKVAVKESSKPTPSSAPAPESAASLETVRDYRLLRLLGQGGMGTVYLAEHTRIGKQVALKLIKSDRLQDEKTKARFEREMRAMGALEHKNLVKAIDAGEHEGRMYLAMEYIDGASVGDIVRIIRQLAKQDACEIVRQAAVGLQHAYQELDDFVHRDIKPSNLLLSRAGVVKVADLGLVRAGNLFDDDLALTATHGFVGTLDYTAPEQIDRGQDVDIRADVYALGATLYKLLAGQVPFSGERFESFSDKIHGISKTLPTPIEELRPDLPNKLTQFIHHMLAKEPLERMTSPGEVAGALQPFCESSNLTALIEQTENRKQQIASEETSTFDFVSSAHTDTRPSIDVPKRKVETAAPARDNRIHVAKVASVAVESPENAVKVQPKDSGGLVPPSFRKWFIYGAGFLALFAGILLIIPREKGDLTIDLNGVDEAKLQIRRFNGPVIDEGFEVKKGADNTLSLRAGEYEVKLVDAEDHSLTLSTDRVTISKNAAARIGISPPPPDNYDSRQEHVVVDDHSKSDSARGQIPDEVVARTPTPKGVPVELPVPSSPTVEPTQIREAANVVKTTLAQPAPTHLSPWKTLPNGNRYLMITVGHAGRIAAVTIKPDETQFATAGEDRVLRIWSSEGELLRALPMEEQIIAMSWSPNGEDLVAAVGDQLRFLDPNTGKGRNKLPNYVRSDHITSVEWSPDGKSLLVCDGREIEVINMATNEFDAISFQGCNSAKWRNEEEIVAYRADHSDEGTFVLHAIDVATKKQRRVAQFDSDLPVWSVSPNGKYATNTSSHDQIRLTELETGAVQTLSASLGGVMSVSWAGNDALRILSSGSGEAEFFNVTLGSEPKTSKLGKLEFQHGAGSASASKGNLGVFTHEDGAVTISRRDKPLKTIAGAFARKQKGIFWRDQGRKLCLPEVELEINGSKRHLVVDVENGSFFASDYAGPAFPNNDSLVTSLVEHDHAKYFVWDVNTQQRTSPISRYDEAEIQTISPNLKSVIQHDYVNPPQHVDLGSGHKTTLNPNALGCIPAWSPSGRRVAFTAEHSGIGILHEGGVSLYNIEPWHGGVAKGMSWRHPNRLEVISGDGAIASIDMAEDGLTITRVEEYETNCEMASVSDRHVALFDPFVSRVYIFDRNRSRHTGTLQLLPRHQVAIFRADGSYIDNPQVERYLTYVVASPDSEYTVVSPSDFHKTHGSNKVGELNLIEGVDSSPMDVAVPSAIHDQQPPSDATQRVADVHPSSLVSDPPKIEGLRSWTIEAVAPRNYINNAAYSPDETIVAIGGRIDRAVRLYDAQNQTLQKMIIAPTPGTFVWGDTRSQIITGGEFGELIVWNVKSGSVMSRRKLFDRHILGMKRINGRELLVFSQVPLVNAFPDWIRPEVSCQLDIVDLSKGTTTTIAESMSTNMWPGQFGAMANGDLVFAIIPNPDSEFEGILTVWDRNGKNLKTIDGVTAAQLSPDGKKLAIAGRTRTIVVDAKSLTKKKLKRLWGSPKLEYHVTSMAWASNNRSLALSLDSQQIHVVDTTKPLTRLPPATGTSYWPRQLSWTKDGKRLFCQDDADVREFYVDSNATTLHIQSVASGQRWSRTTLEPVFQHGLWLAQNQIHDGDLAWSEDRKFFATVSPDPGIFLNDGGQKLPFDTDGRFEFSRDSRFVSMTSGKTITIFDLNKETEHSRIELSEDVQDVGFAPESTLFATTNRGIYHFETSGKQLSYWNHENAGTLAVSPDGRLLGVQLAGDLTICDCEGGGDKIEATGWMCGAAAFRWESNSELRAICRDGTIRSIDAASGAKRVLHTWDARGSIASPDNLTHGYETYCNSDQVTWSRADGSIGVMNVSTGEYCLLVHSVDGQWLAVSPSGHYRGSPYIERKIRFVATTDEGQQLSLTPAEFSKQFGWTNDPDSVWPFNSDPD